ncbi:MAG: hypothetical protein ACYSU0_23050, partial [Planctomycetota bacterium]
MHSRGKKRGGASLLAAVVLLSAAGCRLTGGDPRDGAAPSRPEVHGATQTTASYTAWGGFSNVEATSVRVISNGREHRICRAIKEVIEHGKPPRVAMARVPQEYHAKLWESLEALNVFSLAGASYPITDDFLYECEAAAPLRRHVFTAYGIQFLEDWRYRRFVHLLAECAFRFIDIPEHLESLRSGATEARRKAISELCELPRSVLVSAAPVGDILRAFDGLASEQRGSLFEDMGQLLVKIGPPAVPVMMPCLEGDDQLKRLLAFIVLGHAAEEASDAIPALERLAAASENPTSEEGPPRLVRIIRGLEGAVRMWHDARLTAAAFSPDGATVACTGGGLVHLWDIGKKEETG